MRIFSKLNSNEYNNQLEKILENKTFDESVKNLLLSMLYKIENGYADYSIVKTYLLHLYNTYSRLFPIDFCCTFPVTNSSELKNIKFPPHLHIPK